MFPLCTSCDLGIDEASYKKRDIVRPGVTRFASAFLTLQSLAAKRKQLTDMCCSPTWEDCKHTRTKKGKVAHATIMSRAFWKNVSLCIEVWLDEPQILSCFIVSHHATIVKY